MTKKAVVLFSGGLDSTTTLAIALAEGYECYTLSFNYGQKHGVELKAAARLSQKLGAKDHQVFDLPIGELRGSSLTDPNISIPNHVDSDEIPSTYIPARNTIFFAFALGWAEVLKAYHIFAGVTARDYSHYPDCRPEYIKQFQILADLATKDGVEGTKFTLHTPVIHFTKAQTILRGIELGINYGDTISCYRANRQGAACGNCDSCAYRKKGFEESGIKDPTRYYVSEEILI